MAHECFAYGDELLLAISLTTTTSTTTLFPDFTTAGPSRRLAGQSLEWLLPMMRKLVKEVEDFTEQVRQYTAVIWSNMYMLPALFFSYKCIDWP